MKTLLILMLLSLFTLTHAQEPQVDHSQHHPAAKEEVKTIETKNPHDGHDMSEMMKKCAEKHKDKKMCQEDMMKKCMEKMGKDKCAKMMQE